MGAPLLTPEQIRAALGAKVDGKSDAELDAVARQIRELSLVAIDHVKRGAHAEVRP